MDSDNFVEKINCKQLKEYSNRKIPSIFCFHHLDDVRYERIVQLLKLFCKKYPRILAYQISFETYRKHVRFFRIDESLSIWIYLEGKRIHNIYDPCYENLNELFNKINHQCANEMYQDWVKAKMIRQKNMKTKVFNESLKKEKRKLKQKSHNIVCSRRSQSYRNELAKASRLLSTYQVKSSLHTALNNKKYQNSSEIPNYTKNKLNNSIENSHFNDPVYNCNITPSNITKSQKYLSNLKNSAFSPFKLNTLNLNHQNISKKINTEYNKDDSIASSDNNKINILEINKDSLNMDRHLKFIKSPITSKVTNTKQPKIFTPIKVYHILDSNNLIEKNNNYNKLEKETIHKLKQVSNDKILFNVVEKTKNEDSINIENLNNDPEKELFKPAYFINFHKNNDNIK